VLGSMRGALSILGQRLAAVGSGLADTFMRDNKVIPPVLALLALLVFAWVVAGIFVGGADKDQASNRPNLSQPEDPTEGQDSPGPEIGNRNVESYAAFQSKDPFRQLLEPAESTTVTTPPPEGTSGDDQAIGRSPGRGPSGSRGDAGAGATGRDGAGGNHGGRRTGDLLDSGGNLLRP
jgi:hypothetical protein